MTSGDVAVMEQSEIACVASICRSSFRDFVIEFWGTVPGAGKLVWNWHLDVFCDELQRIAEAVFRKEPKRHDLVLNVSPGTSKSTVWSILFPAWVWTRMPSAKLMTASHTESLVLDLASKARHVIKSEKYAACFPEIQFREDQDSKGYYSNTLGGQRYTCTVAGKSPMGFHAHFIIVDDPIDPKKMTSEAEKITAREFMVDVIPTRKDDKLVTVTMLVMQRLGFGDPTDVMLEEGKKEGAAKVRHICIPAELEVGDDGAFLSGDVQPQTIATRYVNGLMDPVRLGPVVLGEYKARGPHYYSTQFLQKPRARAGGMFKSWFFSKRVRSAPYEARRVRFWDRACLVAGTMVETDRGPVPIEDVVAGDMVLTRRGYRRVSWSGMTKKVDELVSVEFSNGSVLTGTADHPVWVRGVGWTPLATLDGGCYNGDFPLEDSSWVEGAAEFGRSSSTEGSRISVVRGSGTTRRGYGARKRSGGRAIRCIGLSGDGTTDPSPVATTFITRTRTITTTLRIISNACLQETIPGSMGTGCGEPRSSSESLSRAWRGGERRKPLRSTTASIQRNSRGSGSGGNTPHGSASSAVASSGASPLASPGSALSCVQIPEGNENSRAGRGCASSAMNGSLEAWPRSVARRVAAENSISTGGAGTPVYDLTVEDAHEFYANGILVHNSTQDGGCFTAGVLVADDGKSWFVEHCEAGQWEPNERNQRMKAIAQRDRARYGPHNEPIILVEDEGGSSGKDAAMSVARALAGFRVKFVHVTGSKDTRAEPWADQCAAGNVYLVDNGEADGTGKADWDVQAFVDEHLRFKPEPGKRLGKYKDRVDATSGGFNWLVNNKNPTGQMHVFRIGPRTEREKKVRMVVMSKQELSVAVIEEPSLLVLINDPGDETPPPKHGIHKLLGEVSLTFADLDPAELQDRWLEPMAPWGVVPDKLVMSQGEAKKLWSMVLRKRADQHDCVVIADDGAADRRGLSVAYSLCDQLGLNRLGANKDQRSLTVPSDPDNVGRGDAPNRHVYETVKVGRVSVM